MRHVGYEHLRRSLGLTALPPWRVAVVRPVRRVEEVQGELQMPAGVAPAVDAPIIQHIVFALRFEGIDLQILAQVLQHVSEEDVLLLITHAPTSRFARCVGFLWEGLTNRRLRNPPAVGGNYVDFFDTSQYVTGVRRRNARWRLDFNGLGTLRYCATVRRTADLQGLLDFNILGRTTEFLDGLSQTMVERTLACAYPCETEATHQLEGGGSNEEKARLFSDLLRQPPRFA